MKSTHLLKFVIIVLSVAALSSCSTTKNAEKNFYAVYSQKLGIQLEGSEDKDLIKAMASWKGVPYRYGAASKKGTDCSGFTSQLYQEVYGKQLHRSSHDQVKDVRYISKRKLKAGDLIFFKIESRKVSHVAVYVADNKFIHATTRKGVMVDDMDNTYYSKYYYKSGRVKM
ncbi:MAG: NlpC/P60 family protein [Chloroflexia bacterium]|nr:NlpC/P60 family protein [Chloroflexia bacterium]